MITLVVSLTLLGAGSPGRQEQESCDAVPEGLWAGVFEAFDPNGELFFAGTLVLDVTEYGQVRGFGDFVDRDGTEFGLEMHGHVNMDGRFVIVGLVSDHDGVPIGGCSEVTEEGEKWSSDFIFMNGTFFTGRFELSRM